MSTISAKVCMRLSESIKREQSCDSSNHRPQCRNGRNDDARQEVAFVSQCCASNYLGTNLLPVFVGNRLDTFFRS